MNTSFLKGVAVGVVISIAAFAIKMGASSRDVKPTPAPVARADKSGDQFKEKDSELAAVRRENSELKDQLAQSKTKVDKLEAAAPKAAAESKEAEAKAAKEAEEKKKAQEKWADQKMIAEVLIGKDIPEDMLKALGLDPGQKDVINAIWKQEGPKMWAIVRQVGAENPDNALPKDEGIGLVLAALGPNLTEEQKKIGQMMQDPDVLTKTFYLEEVLGNSPIVKITELTRALRQQTLAAMAPTLSEEQRAKAEKYLTTALNFAGAGFNFPLNFQIRRAK